MNFTTDHRFRSPLLFFNLRSRTVAALTTVLFCFVSLVASAVAQSEVDEPVDEMKLAVKVAELQLQLADS